jgi:recombination protein RecT
MTITNESIQTNKSKEWKLQNLIERRSTIEDLLKRNKEKLHLALPAHLTPEKLIGTVLTSFARNPELLNCTQTSLLGAVWTAAQLGLNPNGLLGEGYLQPYKNKKKNVTECQFIPGYRGYIKLAYQSMKVKTFQAEGVYEKDHFMYEKGLNPKLEHIPSKPPRGELIAVYTIVQLINGGILFDVMWKAEIELIRLASPGKDSPAWKNHYDEMAKKTGIRRMQKITPLSTELETAAGLDEKAEVLDESQRTDLALIDVDISPEINQEVSDTMVSDAEIVSEEEKSEQVNQAKEKSEAAVNSAIDQVKKTNGNGELKELQGWVGLYQNQVNEAREKKDKKAEEEAQKKLTEAVGNVNNYLKNKSASGGKSANGGGGQK